MFCQVRRCAQFLSIEEIDMSFLQRFTVERIILNNKTLIQTNLVCPIVNLLFGLQIQFRRVAKPHKDSFGLLHIRLVAEIDFLNESRHDNRFTGTGRSSKRYYLVLMRLFIEILRIGTIPAQVFHSTLLECH